MIGFQFNESSISDPPGCGTALDVTVYFDSARLDNIRASVGLNAYLGYGCESHGH
jgi:hypothetical protein